ncbi:MAG: alpha-amylase family glycosyl hydrolase, partial [Oleibacter sp.]|nr:alpha-amylase family glycosyl hydrolase [Thalassolituus sp.]
MSETALSQFKHRIERIYHTVNHVTDYDAITQDIMRCCHSFCEKTGRTFLDQPVEPEHERWSQEDVILITYGDSIRTEGEAPMHTLSEFLQTHLKGVINSVHILPFFPFSSDDGFSVIDYYRVNSDLGDWSDVSDIAEHFDLMADLVINHCSRENLWFIDYISNNEPYTEYFIEVDPTTDVSLVTRPRNSSLLSPVHTHRGIRHVWATFSEDQIDLNFANPAVLIEFVKIYLFYIEQGSRFIRLDAVGFLWKKIGTTCIHLPETHEAVKLLRDIINFVAPEVVVITETNVPVKENLSYFGDSDEAHMVYQFGLPPLVLHALNRGNASFLSEWTQSIPPLPTGCTYLNFTAS